jgi:hypothetical protein
MRVEIPFTPQSSIEAPKIPDKKEVTKSVSTDQDEEKQSFVPSPPGSSGTYSVSSLRAAVDYYAKFLTVAQNNIEAAKHPPQIPQSILGRLNAR